MGSWCQVCKTSLCACKLPVTANTLAGTVFAYGQTSSGKTHTMRGTLQEPGITLLAVRDIFNHIATTQDREFLLRVSYMEVWRAHFLYTCSPGMMEIPATRYGLLKCTKPPYLLDGGRSMQEGRLCRYAARAANPCSYCPVQLLL